MWFRDLAVSFLTTIGGVFLVEMVLFFLGTLLMHGGSDGLALFAVFMWPVLVGPVYTATVFCLLWFGCFMLLRKLYGKS